jgi:restriction system protein
MFLGGSPVGLALGPLAPFGWLALAVGCGLLWWQLRGQPAAAKSATAGPARAESETASNPVNHTQRSRPVDRATIEPVTDSVLLRSGQHHFGAQTWGEAVFAVIEWRRFEAVVETLFAQAGFETKTQSHGADEGIDIWLYSRSNPGVPVSVVQCKHWQAKRVGVDKVRELRGVMAAKNVSRGQFATTSTFTEDAIAFAKDNGINLLDVQGMLALIATRTEDQQDALLAAALEGEYWKPTCVNCGVKMVERTPRKGGTAFWGCASYPKCKTTMPKRSA